MHAYYPVLISKEGEVQALKWLDQPNKKTTSPIIELIDGGMKLEKLVVKVKRNWCFDGNQVLIDYSRIKGDAKLGRVNGLLRSLRAGGVNAVPVISPAFLENQKKILKEFIRNKNSCLCIRLSFKNGGFLNSNQVVQETMKDFGVSLNKTILVLDFGFVEASNIDIVKVLAANTISGIRNNKSFKAIVVASGSFPRDLSEFEPSEMPYTLRRLEETLYADVKGRFDFVRYGDYGTKHPDYLPPGEHAASCSIKYTTSNGFIIYRGQIAKNHQLGNGQYIEHCKNLVNSTHYKGESFCWGDNEIKSKAKEVANNPRAKPGNAKTWVTISWSHHISLINSITSN